MSALLEVSGDGTSVRQATAVQEPHLDHPHIWPFQVHCLEKALYVEHLLHERLSTINSLCRMTLAMRFRGFNKKLEDFFFKLFVEAPEPHHQSHDQARGKPIKR